MKNTANIFPLPIIPCLVGLLGLALSFSLGYITEDPNERSLIPDATTAGPQPLTTSPLPYAQESSGASNGNRATVANEIDWDASPEKVLAQIISSESPPTMEAITDFFMKWVKVDPDAAFAAARDLPARFSFKGYLYPRMLATSLLDDPETALRWVPKLQPDMVGFMMFEGEWIGDPAEMAASVKRLPPGMATNIIVITLAREWAKVDREAALKWGQDLSPELRAGAMPLILAEWARQDLKGALDSLNSASSADRQAAAKNVLHVYAQQHPDEAINWALEELGTIDGLEEIIRTWTIEGLDDASTFALNNKNPQLQKAMLKTIARTTAEDGLQDASDWWKTLPKDLLNDAVESSAGTLMRTDRIQFMDLVSQFPEVAITDKLLNGMSTGLVGFEPGEALEWSQGLPGTAAERAATVIAKEWLKQNPTAAKNAVNALPKGIVRDAVVDSINPQN